MGKTGKNLWKYRSGPAIPTHQEPKNFKRTGVCKQVRAWGPLAGRGGARSVRWSAGQGGGHGLRREVASLPARGQGQGRERGRSVGRESGRGGVGDKPRGSAFVSRVAAAVEVPRSGEGPAQLIESQVPGEAPRSPRRDAHAPRALSPLRTVSRARRAQESASPPRRETTPTQQGRGR